jgi:hypothetical protein
MKKSRYTEEQIIVSPRIWCASVRIHPNARRGTNQGIAGSLANNLFGINTNDSLGGSQSR